MAKVLTTDNLELIATTILSEVDEKLSTLPTMVYTLELSFVPSEGNGADVQFLAGSNNIDTGTGAGVTYVYLKDTRHRINVTITGGNTVTLQFNDSSITWGTNYKIVGVWTGDVGSDSSSNVTSKSINSKNKSQYNIVFDGYWDSFYGKLLIMIKKI